MGIQGNEALEGSCSRPGPSVQAVRQRRQQEDVLMSGFRQLLNEEWRKQRWFLCAAFFCAALSETVFDVVWKTAARRLDSPILKLGIWESSHAVSVPIRRQDGDRIMELGGLSD
jgi:hypothetical protein